MTSRTKVTRRYSFEAGHFLPKVPKEHKCHRFHGHNYEFDVTITGPIDDIGFIMDFWDMDKIIDPLIEKVDHQTLNDIKGLENPTAEHIAWWFFYRIENELPIKVELEQVRVFETKNCWADAIEENMTMTCNCQCNSNHTS